VAEDGVSDLWSPRQRTRPPLPRRLVRYARRYIDRPVTVARAGARQLDGPKQPVPGYDADRDLAEQWRWSACYAPLTSLYLDQFGAARACCQNTDHRLGDVATSTLREIWDGAATAELRRSLEAGDLTKGCDFCSWQAEETGASPFARTYDIEPAGRRANPRWPVALEFAVSNTCNLQCVMCNGEWSSAIRSKREHLPPLARAYPERFFDELTPFIPHLRKASFTGGEPFLGQDPLRIMDLLVEHGRPDLVLSVVTNATMLSPRIERILRTLTPWVSVSFDGGTAEVYERIRVGASFDRVLANVDRLAEIVRDRGVGMNLTHCLMVDNWETFPELLQLAEGRGLDVAINTVRFPEVHSLYHLPPADLARVVDHLDARTPEVTATVGGSRLATWHEQLSALRARSEARPWPAALGLPPSGAPVPVELTAPRRRR